MIRLQIGETGDMLQGLTFSLQPDTDNTKITIKQYVIFFKNISNSSFTYHSIFYVILSEVEGQNSPYSTQVL